MFYAYKYYSKRRAEKKQAQAQHDDDAQPDENELRTLSAQPHQSNDGPARQKKPFPWKRFLTLAVALSIPVFIETLDYTVVATSQPEIASAFNQLALQSWISTVYLLTSTVFLPFFASVAHVYGRHDALQIALVIFMIGSAISTGAMNLPTVLAGRGISGIGAAGMLAVVRIILADSSSLDENNWQAILLSLLYFPGFCVGPYIGGLLIKVSFRWIFGINLPCCAVGMVLAFLLLRKITKGPQLPRTHHANESKGFPTRPTKPASQLDKLLYIDWIGSALFTIGGILLLLGLNWGSANDWGDTKTIVSLVIGSVLVATCLVWEYVLERVQSRMDKEWASTETKISVQKKNRVWKTDMMLPLAIFRSYDVSASQFAALTSGMVMLVVFYFVAISATIVSGQSSSQAGVQLIYFAPGLGVGSGIGMRLISKFRQPKYPIILGTLIIPISLGLLSWATQRNNQAEVDAFLALAGLGVGVAFGPLAVHARFSQPPDRVAIVVSLNLFFRSLGGLIGLAQCFTVLNVKVTSYLVSHASSIPDGSILGTLSVASLTSVQGIDELPEDVQAVVRAAFGEAVRWCFLSLVPWCSLAFFLCLFLSDIVDGDREPSTPLSSKEESDKPEVNEVH